MEREHKEINDEITDPGKGSIIDTEGGYTHLTEIIAINTLKEIIGQAKDSIEEEKGHFIIPSYVQDNLLVKCEKVLLNYGEIEAEKAMKDAILEYLDMRYKMKERDDERKVKERLPSDTKRK